MEYSLAAIRGGAGALPVQFGTTHTISAAGAGRLSQAPLVHYGETGPSEACLSCG